MMSSPKQSSVSAPSNSTTFGSTSFRDFAYPESTDYATTSSKESSQTPKMTSGTSSTRSSGSAVSTSALLKTTSSREQSRTPCDCLQCGPDVGFCKFLKERKSDKNIDASHFPLPSHIQTKIDTRRLSHNDDSMMHLQTLADREDRAFNSFMQAACQYNRSTTMAALACIKLIRWSIVESSGMEALHEKVAEDAAIIRMAIIGALANSKAVGEMANAVVKVRSTVHSPTAEKMSNDPSSEFSEFIGQSMSAKLNDILSSRLPEESFNPDYVNNHFRECLEDIERNVVIARDSLMSKIALNYAADAKKAALSTFHKIRKNLREDPEADPSKEACKAALTTASANMIMLDFLNKQLTAATKTTSILIQMATEHASRTKKRARRSTLKHLPRKLARCVKNKTEDKADKHYVVDFFEKQLDQAQVANVKTTDAVQQTKQNIENATVLAAEPVEYMTGGRTISQRHCSNVRAELVY